MEFRNQQPGGPAVRPGLPDLDDAQFAQWSGLLRSRTGMVIPAERRSFLTTGLRLRMREIGCGDYQSYYDLLTDRSQGAPEWTVLVDRLTVHETRFFRDQPAIDLLREQVLPEYLADAEQAGSYQAWSVGCATGEEVYTLAMVLDRFFSTEAPQRLFGVVGMDISQPALTTARQAHYSLRQFHHVDEAYRHHYCQALDNGSFTIDSNLRRRVCFAPGNILELDSFPMEGVNLVYCQNVLIYFERDKRCAILDQLAERLVPGGVLIVGPVDIPAWSNPMMERIRFAGTLAFRRLGAAR